MRQKYIYPYIASAIIFFLISIAVLQTYSLMKSHFTHGDDIGIAYTLTKEDFFNRACDNNLAKEEWAFLYQSLGNDKKRFCNFYYYPYIATVIPRNWTYAPFQFWFTQSLLKPENFYSYSDIKWGGRLPSFTFHILGLIFFFLLLTKKIDGIRGGIFIPSVLTLLAAFSLEQRIMASQMESYAIGLLSNCFALYAIIELRNFSTLRKKKLFGLALILAIAIAMQYQALFLALSGLLALLLSHLNIRPISIWLKKYALLNLYFLLCLILTLAILFLRHIGSGGLNWNVGPNNEFVVSSGAIYGKITQFLNLLWSQSAYNFYSVISAIDLGSSPLLSSACGLLFLGLSFLGYVYLVRNRNTPGLYFLLLLFSIYAIVYLTFVFFGRFSYAPTRHFLYFLPIILILVGYGLLLIKPLKFPFAFDAILLALITSYSTLSIFNFSSFESRRQDLIQTFDVPKLFAESGAEQLLLDQFDMEPFFIPSLSNSPIYRYRPQPLCRDYPPLSKLNYTQKFRFFWFSKRVFLDSAGVPVSSNTFGGGAIADYFLRVLRDCHPNLNFAANEITVKKISDTLIHKSDIEIDLSNHTKNGANELFLQTFEVELPRPNKLKE